MSGSLGNIFKLYKGLKNEKEFQVILVKDKDGWFIADVQGLKGCLKLAKSIDSLIIKYKRCNLFSS